MTDKLRTHVLRAQALNANFRQTLFFYATPSTPVVERKCEIYTKYVLHPIPYATFHFSGLFRYSERGTPRHAVRDSACQGTTQ